MEREVGGGIGMGNTCKPMAVSFQCMTKFTTNKKKKKKLSLSPLYFNKTLLHRSSERSSLVSGPGLNSSPPEAKNPGVLSFSNNLSEGYSVAPWVTSEEEQKSGKGLNGEQLDISLGCHQVYSWVHLHPALVIERRKPVMRHLCQ